jgi:citrate synthase
MASNPALAGLEDVVAGQSAISEVNGQTGQLFYRGYDIRDLAREATFEEVVWLLWHGELPTPDELHRLETDLSDSRPLPGPSADLTDREVAEGAAPMPMLRTVASQLQIDDPDARGTARPAELRASFHLVARFPTVVARYHRRCAGQPTVPPPSPAGTATAFLTMLHGQPPDPAEARALDTYLVLLADHEFNASTFTARVIAATLANVDDAVVGALAALSGPLHGGANENVMRMLEAIGSANQAEAYVKDQLAKKQRIPGFGHRVYQTMDPRAAILREVARALSHQRGELRWLDLAEKVEQVVWSTKHLYPNVDFYSAPVLHLLGIPTALFTPVFAISRVAGWTAHVLEQHAHNRLIRPRAEYVGPAYRPFTSLASRRAA